MASEEKSRLRNLQPRDDTRQDPPFQAFTEAGFAYPGDEGGDDTRRDPPPKA
jgi:hypothetical protein